MGPKGPSPLQELESIQYLFPFCKTGIKGFKVLIQFNMAGRSYRAEIRKIFFKDKIHFLGIGFNFD